MNKKNLYLPLITSLAVAVGIFLGMFLNYPQNNSAISLFSGSPQEAKIKKLIDYIHYDYVDKVDTDSLLDGTIRQILGKLDPHSVYIPASEHEAIAEKMNGEFVGVGIQFRMYKDSLTVLNVIPGGPSDKAGILAGDRILFADKDTLYGRKLNSDYIMKTLKGEPGTTVNVTVYRKSDKAVLPFTLKRNYIPLKSVISSYMVNDSLGYIKIDQFSSTTYDEFKEALSALLDQHMKHLVLDLRGNPGGYMGVATKIADEFLEDNKLIVFTKNKGGKIDKTYATSKGSFEKGTVYVLIDENSASASEIVAGALQDNDKGVIVGRRSFGKGLVQQEMSLGDGSAVRLTISRYYTPTGRSIQKPYKGENGLNYNYDYEMRLFHGELTNADSIKVNDSLKFVTPKGKVVYGGGGIVPDVFVGIDTTSFLNRAHYAAMNQFAFDYIDTHRNEFKGLTYDTFFNTFDQDHKILNRYIDHVRDQYHVEVTKTDLVAYYLKALFARYLFDENAFYELINQHDEMMNKIEQLEKERTN